MRLDRLSIRNFKGFASRDFMFHPQFNLIVGTNGTGKTSALDALSVAVGSWFLGVRGTDSRHIRAAEVMLKDFAHEEIDDDGQRHLNVHWEYGCLGKRGENMKRTDEETDIERLEPTL